LKRNGFFVCPLKRAGYPKTKGLISQRVFFRGEGAVSFRVCVFTSESCQFHAFVIQKVGDRFNEFVLSRLFWGNDYSCRFFLVEISLPRKLHGNTKTNCQNDVGGASNNDDSNPDPSISQSSQD